MKRQSEGFDPFQGEIPTIEGTAVDAPQPIADSADHITDNRSQDDPPTPTTSRQDEVSPEDAAINAAITHQRTWRPASVRAALRQAITEGLPAEVAYRVIVDLARGDIYGPTTAGPQRIIARGPWWTPGTVMVAKPSSTKERCPRHPGQFVDFCSCCGGESLGQSPQGPTIRPARRMPSSARSLLAEIPALQRGRRGKD